MAEPRGLPLRSALAAGVGAGGWGLDRPRVRRRLPRRGLPRRPVRRSFSGGGSSRSERRRARRRSSSASFLVRRHAAWPGIRLVPVPDDVRTVDDAGRHDDAGGGARLDRARRPDCVGMARPDLPARGGSCPHWHSAAGIGVVSSVRRLPVADLRDTDRRVVSNGVARGRADGAGVDHLWHALHVHRRRARICACGDGTRTAGWVALSNTAGSMCGPLVATFVLLPQGRCRRIISSPQRSHTPPSALFAAAGAGILSARLRSAGLAGAAAALAVSLAFFPHDLDGTHVLDAHLGAVRRRRLVDRRGAGRSVRIDPADAAQVARRAGLHAPGHQRVLDVRHGCIGAALHAVFRLLAAGGSPRPAPQRPGDLLRGGRHGRRRPRHPRRRSHRRRRHLDATSSR